MTFCRRLAHMVGEPSHYPFRAALMKQQTGAYKTDYKREGIGLRFGHGRTDRHLARKTGEFGSIQF